VLGRIRRRVLFHDPRQARMRCGFITRSAPYFGAVLMTGAELKFLAKRRNPQPALQLLAALSSQAYEFEAFIAAEHFISWIIFQVERRNDGTCDGNAEEIFDFNPRLCGELPGKLFGARVCLPCQP